MIFSWVGTTYLIHKTPSISKKNNLYFLFGNKISPHTHTHTQHNWIAHRRCLTRSRCWRSSPMWRPTWTWSQTAWNAGKRFVECFLSSTHFSAPPCRRLSMRQTLKQTWTVTTRSRLQILTMIYEPSSGDWLSSSLDRFLMGCLLRLAMSLCMMAAVANSPMVKAPGNK